MNTLRAAGVAHKVKSPSHKKTYVLGKKKQDPNHAFYIATPTFMRQKKHSNNPPKVTNVVLVRTKILTSTPLPKVSPLS